MNCNCDNFYSTFSFFLQCAELRWAKEADDSGIKIPGWWHGTHSLGEGSGLCSARQGVTLLANGCVHTCMNVGELIHVHEYVWCYHFLIINVKNESFSLKISHFKFSLSFWKNFFTMALLIFLNILWSFKGKRYCRWTYFFRFEQKSAPKKKKKRTKWKWQLLKTSNYVLSNLLCV